MHGRQKISFPEARSDGLLVEQVGDETVIYDAEGGRAHCLSALAAAVFVRCDGGTPAAEIAELVSTDLGEPATVEQVQAALTQLEESELLRMPADEETSRREMLRRTAIFTTAVSAASAPFVTSITTPAFAAPRAPNSCSIGVDCTAPGFQCGPNPPGATCKCGPCKTNGATGNFVCSLHCTTMGGCGGDLFNNGTAPCCLHGTSGGNCNCSGC